MGTRKSPLANGLFYHVFSRSIAKFIVFNNENEYSRLLKLLGLYRYANFNHKYSGFIKLGARMQQEIVNKMQKENHVLLEVVAFCIMPTHIHLLLKQATDNGISKYINRTLNSYTRCFNKKHRRAGPLWESRFKSIPVPDDEQLLHLTRYIHLNPTSADLVKRPEDWQFSSYGEYINHSSTKNKKHLCDFRKVIDLTPKQYKKFVNDRKSYQRELSLIKSTLIDSYTG